MRVPTQFPNQDSMFLWSVERSCSLCHQFTWLHLKVPSEEIWQFFHIVRPGMLAWGFLGNMCFPDCNIVFIDISQNKPLKRKNLWIYKIYFCVVFLMPQMMKAALCNMISRSPFKDLFDSWIYTVYTCWPSLVIIFSFTEEAEVKHTRSCQTACQRSSGLEGLCEESQGFCPSLWSWFVLLWRMLRHCRSTPCQKGEWFQHYNQWWYC